MSEVKNILIVGVGGQGSLLASRILGTLFLNKGLDVKVSEVHGMAQRGGSVVTYVRAGENVDSPLVPIGEADIIIALEQLEALRWLHYLKPDGAIVFSTQQISPMPVIMGAEKYPQDINEQIISSGVKHIAVDALALAIQAGNAKAANVVLMGAASKMIGYSEKDWDDALCPVVPQKFIDLNLKAFELGRNS